MDISNLLPIAYLGVGGLCSLSVLLTAILFLLKKKTGKMLGLYGLCVALLLAGGFLASNDNPFPQPRISEPEVDYTQSSRGPTPSYIQQIWDAAQSEQGQDETVADDLIATIEPEPEPAAEPAPEEAGSVEAPAAPAEAPTAVKISSPTSSRKHAQDASSNSNSNIPSSDEADSRAEQQRPLTLDNNPTLAPEPELAPLPDRELVPEPYVTYTNPTLVDDPEPSTIYVSGNAPDASQSAYGSNSGNNPSSGSSSSGPYAHDFSNGRVLITTESNNNNDPVYHTRDCKAAKTIPPENSSYYNSAEEAKADGRRICGYCAR